jgi:hypothetical protein
MPPLIVGGGEDPNVRYAGELFDATNRWEHSSLRVLYFLNGGACVAALAFVSHQPSMAIGLILPMYWWVGGLVAAALTTVCGYTSQFAFYLTHTHQWGKRTDRSEVTAAVATWVRRFGYGLFFVSLASFVWGSYLAVNAIAWLAPAFPAR